MKGLLNKSVFYNILTVVSFVIAGIIYYLLYCYMLPMKQADLKENLFEKVNAVSKLSQTIITKALKEQDDVVLLSQVEKIMRLSDISTVYILDNTGKVITHDKTGEWGKVYSDEFTKKILVSKTPSLYTSREARGYIYAAPIVSSSVLCIGISSDKIDTKYELLKRNAGFTALTLLVVAILLLAIILIFQLKLRFRKLELMLDALNAGTIDALETDKGDDEFSKLSFLINELAAKYRSQETADRSSSAEVKGNFALLMQEISKHIKKCMIITDSDNKVMFYNNEICTLLSLSGNAHLGRHILDVLGKSSYIDLLKRSTEQLNTPVEEKIEGILIKVITVGNSKKELLGTIITAE